MSILTKVFVVLVTVLSILLVALIVPFAANTENYQEQLAQARTAELAARMRAQLLESEKSVLLNEESQRMTALKSANDSLHAQVNTLSADLAKARDQIKVLHAQLAKNQAEFSGLIDANRQHGEITSALQSELSERRQQDIDQKTTIIQQVDRINELDSQLQTLNRQVRRFAEQVTERDQRISELENMIARLDPTTRAQLTSGETAAGAAYMASVPIRGRITDVRSVADETFVQVNIGNNDGVETNMKFHIHRGGQYLGTLVITAVDARESAGRMQIVQGQVVKGDEVLSGPM